MIKLYDVNFRFFLGDLSVSKSELQLWHPLTCRMMSYLQFLPQQHLVVPAGRGSSAVQPSRTVSSEVQALSAAPQCHTESHPGGRRSEDSDGS